MRSVIAGINALTIRNLNAYDSLIFNGTQIQSIRWKRKPIWLPTAKTKVFRVSQRKRFPEDEVNEMKRLFNNYRTLSNSVFHYFRTKSLNEKEFINLEKIQKMAQEDFEESNDINNKWNEVRAAIREERFAKERKERKEHIKLRLQKKHEEELERQMLIDMEVKKVKEEVRIIITEENIDEAIEKALETVVDHNAVLHLDGKFKRDIPEKPMSSNVTN